VGIKKKGNKQVPNCVPEVYEIGKDYADHTKRVTPGQSVEVKKVKGFLDRERDKDEQVSEKDVKEWANQESTIYKYRERYKEEWKTKLDEVVSKMLSKI
jgi:hypothetical protein